MNKENLDILVNTIKDSLFILENNECYIDTKENSWETFYGLSDNLIKYIRKIEKENKQLKENWNKLKKELEEKFEEYRYVEDECLRIMAQEDDSILFSMKCIEKGGSNED